MTRTLLYFLIAVLFASCSAEHYLEGQTKSVRRFKKRIPTDLYGNHLLKPSESMQIGTPRMKVKNSTSSSFEESYGREGIKNRSSTIGAEDYNHDSLATNHLSYGNSNDENQPEESQGGYFKIGNPYSIFGVSYEPKDYEEFEESGTASWYGSEFHGKKTANGEIYNKGDVTAAHPTLPLPSIIKATNLHNGKVAIVRVNDRGPFAKNRIMDFSERSAEILGFKEQGTTEVKIELLRQETDEIIAKLQAQN